VNVTKLYKAKPQIKMKLIARHFSLSEIAEKLMLSTRIYLHLEIQLFKGILFRIFAMYKLK
jgi:hypothetical protein